MHALTILSFASLALAAPHHPIKRQTCSDSSTFQWTIQGFNTFTAVPGPDGISTISFNFLDTTSGTSSQCSRSLPPGSGRSAIDPDHTYFCDSNAFQYKYDGTNLALEEAVECGELGLRVVTGSYPIGEALMCYAADDGRVCETVTGAVFLNGTADA